ncbi:hypothetical protein HQN90_05890 [Paenibacillus alba]|uniref:hypothetical protein n=1 Tax=Paenibacillus alba TaxID=1197127 RepID=UPI0015674DA7|nr:hypothetical protein [Paenibacillus alba]NQX65655.1 hypothetical protein [Paenibacillus alba]
MSIFIIFITRITNKIGSHAINTLVLNQKIFNITVKEENGHFLLIDAADSGEMFILASLIQHSMKSNDVIFLEREGTENTDLFIFNGAVNPLTKKDIRKIKKSLSYIKPEIIKLPLVNLHDETVWDTWEHWKYEEQLKIKADKDLAIINTSQLGLKLLLHSCSHLATSYSGHSHFDRNSTKSSPELIIRNMARN